MEELLMLDLLDEEEEEEAATATVVEAPRQPRSRVDALSSLNNDQFRTFFRISKDLFNFVVEIVSPYLRPPSRATDLEIPVRVLAALRFFASGSYQMDVGSNVFMSMSQASVSRCISEVSDALNSPAIFGEYVKFPRSYAELDAVQLQFFQKYNFPGVVGCIDCTHVAIVAPPTDDPERPAHIYINRKGYHSLNVQLICDSSLRILNVNASHPGSSHDSFIWNNSNVLPVMRRIYEDRRGTYYLLGDSGYALRPWCLTPLDEELAPNTPEHNYNTAQKRVRSIIERCNGVLKNRFRCLLKHRVLHYSPQRAGHIVNACVVLHNLCIQHNIPDLNEDDGNNDCDGIFNLELQNVVAAPVARHVDPLLTEGRQVRNALIASRFRNQ